MKKMTIAFEHSSTFDGGLEELYEFFIFFFSAGNVSEIDYGKYGALEHSEREKALKERQFCITEWHYPVRLVVETRDSFWHFKREFNIVPTNEKSGVDYVMRLRPITWIGSVFAPKKSKKGEKDEIFYRLLYEFNTRHQSGIMSVFSDFRIQMKRPS